ncbi:MAG: Hsp20/alpha crystallin family protein [Streptosporangiaceae bacterium]
MSTPTRRQGRHFPDLFDWMESPLAMFRPMLGQGMRMEDYVRDGEYVVRAELPGVDPEKEVEVSVRDGILSIRAERKEEQIRKSHSEFRYGVFSRQIALPPGADEEHVEASYDKGILEVVVAMKREDRRKTEKRIPVKRGK